MRKKHLIQENNEISMKLSETEKQVENLKTDASVKEQKIAELEKEVKLLSDKLAAAESNSNNEIITGEDSTEKLNQENTKAEEMQREIIRLSEELKTVKSANAAEIDEKNQEIDDYKSEINRLKLQLDKSQNFTGDLNPAKDKKIIELEQRIEQLTANLNATKPLKELEAKVARQALITKDLNYGANVIGKAVIAAAKCCNELTSNPSQNSKELVNLVLGKTEVIKAEILKIVSSDMEFEEKQAEIDAYLAQALDYYNSVMAQEI